MHDSIKLDVSDALFVEIIHTDAHPSGQGIAEPSGHVDLYPNNGYAQPGCNVSKKYPPLLKLTRDSIKPGDIYPGCSHKRSFKYYIDAIKNSECNYIGFHCSNYTMYLKGGCTSCECLGGTPQCYQLGLDTPLNTSVFSTACSTVYYFRTGSAEPFCLDVYKFDFSFGTDPKFPKKVSGYFEVNLTSIDTITVINSMLLNEFRLYSVIDQCARNYTFIGWVYPPPVINIIAYLRVKWIYEGRSLSLNKNAPVFINNITASHIRINETMRNKLCPDKSQGLQLDSGQIEYFELCEPFKNESLYKPVINDIDSNIVDLSLHV